MSSNQTNARTFKAIETAYAGYKFRSRLEARWAVFFDALGIKWEYEPEGFILADGTWYLPDFWLPRFCGDGGLWIEVKPCGGDFSTAKKFARDTGKSILLAEGTPDLVIYGLADGENSDGDAYFDSYVHSENRLFYYSGDDIMNPSGEEIDGVIGIAVTAARSARFEHGETPKPQR